MTNWNGDSYTKSSKNVVDSLNVAFPLYISSRVSYRISFPVSLLQPLSPLFKVGINSDFGFIHLHTPWELLLD